MFDLALLLTLQPPMPPVLPPLAIERPYAATTSFTPEMRAHNIVESYTKSIESWERNVVDRRRSLDAKARAEGGLPDMVLDALEQAVVDLDQVAEVRAIQASRYRKRIQREVKRQMRDDPASGAVAKIIARGLIACNDRVVARLLEESLALRAFRSDYDPESRGGPTFDNPDELEKHLLAELA